MTVLSSSTAIGCSAWPICPHVAARPLLRAPEWACPRQAAVGLGGNGLAETTCQDGKPISFRPSSRSASSTAVGAGAGSGAGVTYQFWLSFYGFHTKILTFFRGATGHSTFPSRLRVMLALAALSGRECHPWLVTMCTRQTQPGRG